MSNDDSNASARSFPWLKALALVAGVALFLVVARFLGGTIPAFAEWVDSLGFWGPLVFIVGYAIATIAFVPGSLLTLAGGAIFGLAKGTLIVFAGAVLGAVGAFLIGRYLARDAIARRLENNPRFAAIDRAVGEQGLKITTLLRLSPAFPFILLNYGLGLTKVKLRDYVLASFGMLPGTLLYVYYGKVIGSVAAITSGEQAEGGASGTLLFVGGLLATVVATVLITRAARKALREVDGLEQAQP